MTLGSFLMDGRTSSLTQVIKDVNLFDFIELKTILRICRETYALAKLTFD